MKNILFVSYYTDEYVRWARLLEMSLTYHGLPSKMIYKKTAGEWHKNVLRKPRIISDAISNAEGYDAICWIDADSVVVKHPALLYELDCDAAFPVFLPGRKMYREPMAGVMLFRRCKKAIKFMDNVAKRIDKYIDQPRLDQRAMSGAVAATRYMNIAVLPRSYICIRELPPRTQQQALASEVKSDGIDLAVLPTSYVDLDEDAGGLGPVIVSRRLARFAYPTNEVHQIALDEDGRRVLGTFEPARQSVTDLIEKMKESGVQTTI